MRHLKSGTGVVAVPGDTEVCQAAFDGVRWPPWTGSDHCLLLAHKLDHSPQTRGIHKSVIRALPPAPRKMGFTEEETLQGGLCWPRQQGRGSGHIWS